jgi:hypothetical protein
VSEKHVQKAILDYLAAKRVLAFRMNSGMLRNPAGRPVTFGVPGMADVLAFINWQYAIQPLWIECKAPRGKQTEIQKSFQEQVEAHGHKYLIARQLEDVMEAL